MSLFIVPEYKLAECGPEVMEIVACRGRAISDYDGEAAWAISPSVFAGNDTWYPEVVDFIKDHGYLACPTDIRSWQ